MRFKDKALSGIRWTTLEKMGRAGFQLIQISILTRFLPKEIFGIVAIALVVIAFSNIFVDLGITTAILFKQDATREEYSSVYWLNIFISLLLYCALYFGAPYIAAFYEESMLKEIIPVLGLNILLIALGRQHRTILQKEFRFKSIAITELFSFGSGLLCAVILVLNDTGIYSLIYSTLLASGISNTSFLMLNLKANPIKFHFKPSDTKIFLKVGGYQTGSRILDFFSKEADIFLIGKLMGVEILGLYTLAKQIVFKLFVFLNPIILNVLSPLLSAIKNNDEQLEAIFLKVLNYLSTLSFPLYYIIILFSSEILLYLYGESYVEAKYVLSFLAIHYAVITILNSTSSLQIATGRTDLGLIWTILRLLITPIIIFIGSYFGINIIALMIAILSIVLIVPMWFIQIKQMSNIRIIDYLNQFIKKLILCISMVILYFFIDANLSIQYISFIKSLFFITYMYLLFINNKEDFNNAVILIRKITS